MDGSTVIDIDCNLGEIVIPEYADDTTYKMQMCIRDSNNIIVFHQDYSRLRLEEKETLWLHCEARKE